LHGSELKNDAIFLALDQGGHASRAAVIDARGNTLILHAETIETTYRGEDVIEHDPEEVVASLSHVIGRVAADLGDGATRLAGAGLATQRSNVVCWDRNSGRALSPIISWQDRRARHWLEGLAGSAAVVRRRTGLMLSPHYGASKLRWCLDNLDAVRAAAAAGTLAWGPMASFLVHRLLDQRPLLADPVNAARTLLYNPAGGDWDAQLLELFGLPASPLPRCVPNRYPYGHIRVGNLPIPFTVLTGDQSAALFAMGRPDFDAVYVNTGTGVFLQRCGDLLADQPGLLQSVVWRDTDTGIYALEGTINGGAAALHREAGRLGIVGMDAQLPGWLERHSEPPLFLNGIGGLGSPFWVAEFASRYIGEGDVPARLVAVVESIVFMVRRNLEVFAGDGRRPGRVIISGGLAVLDGLCQKLASLADMPVCRGPDIEATLSGLGYLLSGFSDEYRRPPCQHVFEPRPDAALKGRYQRWFEAMEKALGHHLQP